MVLLGVLIQQLELSEGEGERDEGKIKEAAGELLRHIEFIKQQLDAEEEGEAGYGSELFNQLFKVLTEIVNKGFAALGDSKNDTLLNLKQVFAILEAKDKEEYEEIKKSKWKRKYIWKISQDPALAAKIESETAKAKALGIYIDILPNEEEQAKSANSEPAPANPLVVGTLVRVIKEGDSYRAQIESESK